jgi:Lhr-like helicase
VWSDDAPDHPLLREAWREVLEERMDLRAAEAFRASVAAGDVELRLLPAAPHVSPYGACILHPRSGTGSDRAAALRDHVERWVEKVGAPRRGGG